MKRATIIGLSVGFGILAVLLVIITVCLLLVRCFQTYRAETIQVGDTYTLYGIEHTLQPLPGSNSPMSRTAWRANSRACTAT